MAGIRGLLTWLWAGPAAAKRATLADPDATLMEALGATRSAAGVAVTPDSAMRLSAVSACVRLIAESIASLPLHVYQRSEAGRQRITGSPEFRLLHDEPNSRMTSFTFRETMAAHVLLYGNAYAVILRSAGGVPVGLLPVAGSVVVITKLSNGELAYTVTLDDKSFTLSQWDIIHVPGLAFDGISGMSPIRYAAESIGLGLAAERYGGSFFGNGSTPSGYISLPGKLSKEQAATMRAAWESVYGYNGGAGGNRTAVLFESGKFEKISIAPNEAQFIETRKFQVSEIARWYRVPPHMIGDLERATFSNIEHQALEFVTHTLRPWLVRFEQEFNRKLFPSSSAGEANELYCEFNVDGLLRGDINSRGNYYTKGRQWGWLSANDIRRLENMEPIDGGDQYLTPLNMQSAADAGSTVPQEDA
jgi:HK97 family phage portal protein